MKFTADVKAALATLHNAAENDFERHRIDVLERDLTAPPKVEIIDDTHQKFNGIVYNRIKKGHFKTTKNLHRDVWQYFFGVIPDGYVIHHIDENKDNNDISNLQCLTAKEHTKLHMENREINECTCALCGKKFSSVFQAVFCSPECNQRSYYLNKKNWVTKTCPVCGKEFSTPHISNNESVCCSRACGLKRRDEKLRSIKESKIFVCKQCGKEFTSASTNSEIFCSEHCRYLYRKEHDRITATCPVCGKIFNFYRREKKKFCSRACANRWNAKNKRHQDIHCQTALE